MALKEPPTGTSVLIATSSNRYSLPVCNVVPSALRNAQKRPLIALWPQATVAGRCGLSRPGCPAARPDYRLRR